MADEIIDLRDRIEKMRIQIENEATEQISVDAPAEVHQKTSKYPSPLLKSIIHIKFKPNTSNNRY